jgi:uncharacterized protein YndB with AHSA1/START domain
MENITVQSIIKAPITKVWDYWTMAKHVTEWNFASTDWYCPKAVNNLVIGGEFHYTMAAKDNTISFDFWGVYVKIEPQKFLEITLGDGRNMSVEFEVLGEETRVTEIFEPEAVNSVELQKGGWQAILANFKQYVEG